MRLSTFLPFLITFFCQTAFGQSDFRNGYVVLNHGDTISGLVNFKELGDEKSCEFKSTQNPAAVTYLPNDIVGYGFIGGKVYRSRVVEVGSDSARILFLELIVKGTLSLYRSDSYFWVETQRTGIHAVVNEAKPFFVEGREVLKYSNKHIATLNMLMYDCPSLKSRIERIRITEVALTKLVLDYNECKGEKAVLPEENKPAFKAIAGLTIGGNFSHAEVFTEYPEYDHVKGTYKNAYYPMLGLSGDFLTPRISERLSFHVAAFYLRSKYYNHTIIDQTTVIKTNFVTFDFKQIKIPFGFRYTIPTGSFHSFISAGGSFTGYLDKSSSWHQDVELQAVHLVTHTQMPDPVQLSNSQFGFWGGVGISKSMNEKLDGAIELRFERTNGFVSVPERFNGVRSSISNFQVVFFVRTK